MKNRIDLYSAYQKYKKDNQKTSKNWNYVVLLLVVGLLLGAYGLKLTLDKHILTQENQEMSAYVQQTENLTKLKEAESITASIQTMRTLREQLDAVQSVFDQKQSLSGALLNQIIAVKPNTVTLRAVQGSVPSIQLIITSKDANGPTEYIEALKKVSGIQSIDYRGLTMNDSKTEYVSTITVLLSGGF